MIIDALMLKIAPSEIPASALLFGPEGPGIDSIDALQLVVALEINYGIRIQDEGIARVVLGSVASIAQAVEEHRAGRKLD